MTKALNSTLLLIEDAENAASIDMSMREAGAVIATKNASLTSMNGRAIELLAKHDVVVFETNPDDPIELSAVDSLVGANKKTAIFIALTGEDVSITKARALRTRGVDEVLPKSINAEDLNAVIEDLRASRHPLVGATPASVGFGNVIAVAQSAGGAGATTAAVNLAASLAAKKGRFSKTPGATVALLDFDIQFGSVGTLMDLEDNGGFLEMIESAAVPDANYLKGILQKHSSGVDVLVAPKHMVPVSAIDPGQIATLLDVLKTTHQFVIIDFPRAIVEWLEPVLTRLDDLLIVTDTSVPSIRQAKRLMDIYREDNITVSTRVVISRQSKPFIKPEQVTEGEKLMDTKFQDWLPENVSVARKAADLGRPIVVHKPGSDLAKAYTALAKSIEDKPGLAKQSLAKGAA